MTNWQKKKKKIIWNYYFAWLFNCKRFLVKISVVILWMKFWEYSVDVHYSWLCEAQLMPWNINTDATLIQGHHFRSKEFFLGSLLLNVTLKDRLASIFYILHVSFPFIHLARWNTFESALLLVCIAALIYFGSREISIYLSGYYSST